MTHRLHWDEGDIEVLPRRTPPRTDLVGNEHSGNYGHAGRKGEVGGSAPSHSFGRSEKVDSVVRDALDEMGDRQADPREHHIGIDAETGERLFDVTGDAGGPEGALAQGIANPTLDDLRPSAGVVPFEKIHDKHVIDIHTHPKVKGGAFSGEDLGLMTGSHIDTMLVVDDDSVGVLRKTDAFREHQEAAWKRETTEKSPAADRPWTPRRVRDRYNEVLDEMTTADKTWEVDQVLHDSLKQVATEMGVEFSVMPRKERTKNLGGAGSGNFGHSGRPGERGGSGAGDGASAEFREYEEAWAGGVGDYGDSEAGRAIQTHPDYPAYHANLVKELEATHGSEIPVYRAVTQETYEGMESGDFVGPIGVTTDPDVAKNWGRFAANRGRPLTVLKTTIKPEIAVMRGKAEEREIVIDGDWVSFHQWEQIGTSTAKGFAPKSLSADLDAEAQFRLSLERDPMSLLTLSPRSTQFDGPPHIYRLGFCVTCGVLTRECRQYQLAAEAAWTENLHPRDSGGEFTDGGSAGGASQATPKSAQARSGTSKSAPVEKYGYAPKAPPAPSGPSKTAAAEPYGTGPEKPHATPTKTPPSTTATPSPTSTAPAPVTTPPHDPVLISPSHNLGLSNTIKAKTQGVIAKMKPDEADALMTGYKQASKAGYPGSIDDFLIDQAALYQFAEEGDPRFQTFFYADTLDALMNDPDTKSVVNYSKGTQSGPGKKGGGGGGGKAGPDPAAEADKAAEKEAKAKEKADAKAAKDAAKAGGKGGGGGAAAPAPASGPAPAPAPAAGPAHGGPAPPAPSIPSPVAANVHAIVTTMSPGESAALTEGFTAAQAAGFEGTSEDYFVQQMALYQFAEEGDPRFGTWFSGDTMDKAQADPVLWARVQSEVATQQHATSLSALDTDASFRLSLDCGESLSSPFTLASRPARFDGPVHLYRLGFCLTCGTVTRECVLLLGGVGSGFFGHAGRIGEVGGSATDKGGGGGPSRRSGESGGHSRKTTLNADEQAKLGTYIGKIQTKLAGGENPTDQAKADLAILEQGVSKYPIAVTKPPARDTRDMFTVPGKAKDEYGLALTPERQALHDAIVARYKAISEAARTDKPQVIVQGGGPASGKSSSLQEGDKAKSLTVDPDEIRLLFPEYAGQASGDEFHLAAAFTHEEASSLAKRIAKETGPDHNLIIDGTGDNESDKMIEKIEKYRAQGQPVIGRYSTTPIAVAEARAAQRAEHPPYREVPNSTLAATHMGVSRVLPELLEKDAFDQVELVDTDVPLGSPPIKVMSKERGKPIVVHNQAAWDRFLAKSDPKEEARIRAEGRARGEM